MGGASSSPTKQTQEQADLSYLSERFAFGDDEFKHVYRAYHELMKKEKRTSFLADWAVQCIHDSTRSPSSQINNSTELRPSASETGNDKMDVASIRKERETLIQVVETEILPRGFGNLLYKRAFMAPGDKLFYGATDTESTNNTTASSTSPMSVDEHTRKSRLEAIFEGLSNCSRRGAKQALTVLFTVCLDEHEGKDSDSNSQSKMASHRIKASKFVDIGYRLALASAFLKAAADDLDISAYLPIQSTDRHADSTLHALGNSIVEKSRSRRERNLLLSEDDGDDGTAMLEHGWVDLDDILEWGDSVAPVFASILPTFMYQIFFPGRPYPPSRTPFDFPRTLSESSFFTTPNSPLLFIFGCLSSALDGAYFRLYTSDSDGLSFNRLQNALLGYSGPTLLIIRAATSGGIFGAFTASPWKENKDFYGNSDCFLFQMSPVTAVYRPTGNSQHFMYCNSSARSRGYDQQAHGIGFGGSVDQPRLFLAENFDDCVAASADLTFENGSLLPTVLSSAASEASEQTMPSRQQHFTIDSLEVWGVGGDDIVMQALDARDKSRAIRDEGIRRARKVDKAQFLDDFRSGAISSKAFQHRQQIDGRADQDCEERIKKKYDYEE